MTSPAPLEPDDARDLDRNANDEVMPVGEMTFAEYLVFDDGSRERRYEYVGGVVYGMSYSTLAHGAIAANVAFRLTASAPDGNCFVLSNSARVLTPRGSTYVPDVVVDCGPQPPAVSLYREHPCLLVEVLSPSTRQVDLTDKLEEYREIETLQAYWIIESTWRCVYRHWRDVGGAWRYEEIVGDGAVPVPCPVATSLTLDQIYQRVDVPREPPPPHLRRVREVGAEYAVGEVVPVSADAG
ncbi:hypothetical protein tb265_16700 [Gemmatimonadetes bacterium T265]|nr:hypothetical protein tb265_16700 [Gemmatimonadetes bacterium T265]